MDNGTFKKRCFYVGTTVVLLFIVLSALNHIGWFLSIAGKGLSKVGYYVSPLIYAFLIAYLMHIPTFKLEELMMKNRKLAEMKPRRMRVMTTVISYLGIVVFAVILIVSVYLMIGGQLSSNTGIQQVIQYIMDYIMNLDLGEFEFAADSSFSEVIETVRLWIQEHLLSNIADISGMVKNIGSVVVKIVMSIIISLYFVMDYEALTGRLKSFYMGTAGRLSIGRKIFHVVEVFDRVFMQFLRGQMLEACIVAVLSVVALRIAGVNYYGIIGVISGICNLIPYVGPWIGGAIAAIVSVLGGGWMTAVWAVVAMIIVQQIDNNLLAPRIVGDSVGLHPVVIMVMLIIGSDIGGLPGMLLAVPVAATVKSIMDEKKGKRAASEAVEVEAAASEDVSENGDDSKSEDVSGAGDEEN